MTQLNRLFHTVLIILPDFADPAINTRFSLLPKFNMVTSFYAALAALWMVLLSLRVIKCRRIKKIRLGDGGDPELLAVIRTQGNAAEYIPITLLLLILLELEQAHVAIIHAGGMVMLAGRLLHGYGLSTDNLKYRVPGMQLTLCNIISLALITLAYAVYRLVWGA